VIRRLLPLLLVAFAVTGCGGGSADDAPPQVTFTAGQASVVAKPAQYCDLKLTDCHNDDTAPVDLAVPAGTPLQVTVPKAISATPWQVVFTYRDATGAQTDGRSPVFAMGAQDGYELQLPAPDDRLLAAQVQQFGPAPQADPETGELQFPIRGSWVLTTSA
jgi:hypothetical protein